MADVIKCDIYDHFEIACMRRSEVSLELHSGETINGVAHNLLTKDSKEFLIVKRDEGEHEINLKDIDILEFVKSGERVRVS